MNFQHQISIAVKKRAADAINGVILDLKIQFMK